MPAAKKYFRGARRPVDVAWVRRATALRKKMNLTQDEMAAMLGVAAVTLRKWELGTRALTHAQPDRSRIRRRILKLEDLVKAAKPGETFKLKVKRPKVIRVD